MITKMFAVLGSSECPYNSELWQIASEVGSEAARRDFVICTGGTKGVAAAAGYAAKEAGGLVVGILPAEKSSYEPVRLDTKAATILIRTGLPPKARNVILLSSCYGAIVVGGGYGTLNEVTIAISHHLPLVIIEGFGGAADLVRQIIEKLGQKQNIEFVSNARDAIDNIEAMVLKSTDKVEPALY